MVVPAAQTRRIGSAVYGLAMIAFAVECFVRFDGVPQLEPFPAWLGMRPALAVISGVVLLLGGILINARRLAPRGALALAVLFGIWLIALQLPIVLANPANGGKWVVFFEVLAIDAAAWWLSSGLMREEGATSNLWPGIALAARIAFGLSFLAFGISHFMYHGYVESVIPGWIPAHKFFTYFTACAHIAAGLAILSRVKDRLAATLLGVMFGSWVLIVHLPRVAANPTHANEWTSLIVALAMCGAGFLFASR